MSEACQEKVFLANKTPQIEQEQSFAKNSESDAVFQKNNYAHMTSK